MVIDTHGHIVPGSFPVCPPGVPTAQWPSMDQLPEGGARMMIGGAEFRVFESVYWDMAARVEQLDRDGITVQILSPLPELLGYWYDPRATAAMADHIHATIAAAIATAPTRLAGIGMLPLQDIDAAVATARSVKALGFAGVLLGSNVNGVSLADARFDPVWQALEALDLAVLVHGYRPAGADRLLGSPLLAPIVGVPQDTAAVLASFIMTDILGRFPALRLGFAHGGGSFGAVLGRMDCVWRKFPAMQAALPIGPLDYVRRFAFDTVTFSTDYLRYLIAVTGQACLMAGTDGPTPIGQTELAAFVAAACDGDQTRTENILWRNATRFFCSGSPRRARRGRRQQDQTTCLTPILPLCRTSSPWRRRCIGAP